MMEVWIGRNGERHGPYPESSIRDWLASGQISRDDLGWYEGLADWQPLSVLFPDASATIDATPPPLSPHAPPHASVAMPASLALDDYAGFWKRLVAFLLDMIVLYIPNLLIMAAMGSGAAKLAMQQRLQQATSSGDAHLMIDAYSAFYTTMWPAFVVTTLLGLAYFAFCESSPWQATVGKLALGLRVTDLDGNRIGLGRALGRYLGKFVSSLILDIGFLMVGWTRRKQGLHDMMAGTLVLNGRANAPKPTAHSAGGSSFRA